MAITTDSYIEVRDTATALQDKIGLSKALDNYTVEEITSYCYCGADNNFIKYPLKRSDVQAFLSDVDIPFHIETDASNRMTFTVGDRTPYAGNEDLYGRIVWLQNITNISSNVITENNCANYKLVTEMKANHYCYEWNSPETISCGSSTYGTTDWSGSDMTAHKVWYSSGGSLNYYKDFTGGEIIDLSSHKIHPFFICEIDEKMYCLSLGFNINYYKSNYNFYTLDPSYPPTEGYTYTSWDESDSFDVTVAAQQTWDSTFANTGWNYPYVYTRTGPGEYGWATILQGFDDDNINGFGVVGGTEYNLDMGWEFHYYFKERDDAYKLISGAGLYFKTDKIYKPIIDNGYVTGYTDNLSTPSEIDDWQGSTNHNIPPTPPGPTPPGPGYDDDPWSGATFSGVGVGGAGAFAKCYYMTSTELANLRSWMNSNNVPEGFDPMAQIIGLSQVPVSLSGDDNTTVQFVNSSAVYDPGVTRLVDSGVSTQISMGTPKRYSLGSVNITRRMQERGEPYLDYDCQIELYLPLIGMFSLDTQAVMGRTITAEAVLDPISGTLAAYAYVTRDGQNLPIAYGSTTIGVDLPITAQQYSVARAALKQANAQLGTSLLSSTLSLIAAATAGGKGSGTGAKTATGSTNGLAAAGIREAGADYMKASQAGNVFGDFMQWGRTIRQLSYGNNTAIAGSFGGSTAQWSYPFTPYVKIIRPRYEKPSNYAHSQGVPCVQTKTVGSCTGFIQCIGVDVSGITGATDIELQAIQSALANGVFAGGGS